MEQVPERKPGLKVLWIVCAGVVSFAAIIAAVFWVKLPDQPIASVPKLTEAPVVKLRIALNSTSGEQIESEKSAIASKSEVAASNVPNSGVQNLDAKPSPTPTAQPWEQPTPTPEPKERRAQMKVTKFPVAISWYVQQGEPFVKWLSTNPQFQEIANSSLGKGLIHEASRILKVRAEDLKLEGMKGEFLGQVLTELASAGAAVHYDVSQGKNGYVLSFKRQGSALASRLLPLLVAATLKREYQIQDKPISVQEILLSDQAFFISELNGQVYVGTSLRTVLNVIENAASLNAPTFAQGQKADLAMTIRGEAWFDRLLLPLSGSKEWHADVAVNLSDPASAPFQVVSSAKVFSYFRPKLETGVLAAVPQDVFGAVVTSIAIPDEMNQQRWDDLIASVQASAPSNTPNAEAKPTSGDMGGMALIWDLSSKYDKNYSSIGIAVKAPTSSEEGAMAWEDYFNDGVTTDTCAGEKVWIASNSELLLTRMKEACDGQSPSVFKSPRFNATSPGATQFYAMLNPTQSFAELFEVGVTQSGLVASADASGSDPEWKKQYDAAVERARSEAKTTFSKIPTFVLSGNPQAEKLTLNGALVH